jgi:hypothetical protein
MKHAAQNAWKHHLPFARVESNPSIVKQLSLVLLNHLNNVSSWASSMPDV